VEESASASCARIESTLALASWKRSSAVMKGEVMSRVPSSREATEARSERSARVACRLAVGTRRSKLARPLSSLTLMFDDRTIPS
jgi:hypothetical protein